MNLSGELEGVNSQILSRSGGNIGLGFAIPAEMVRLVTDQLIRDGVVRRSQLGVVVQGVTADLAAALGLEQPRGALVSDVTPGRPAARTGLQAGDVITAIDGRVVVDANALRNQVASTTPGSTVTLDVLREGEARQVTAELVAQPSRAVARASAGTDGDAGAGRLGVAVSPVTSELRARLGLPPWATGLVVTSVDPDGPAAQAGLQEGDVITRANGTAVNDVDALRGALTSRSGRPAVLMVMREGRNLFVAVPERS